MGDGGWTARSTAQAFQRYTKVVMERLGDRLDAVATFNEPWCSVWLSHLYGVHAPGERSMDAALHALHYTNLAHGLSVQTIRDVAPKVPVGLVLNAHEIAAGSDSAADLAAAERAIISTTASSFDPVFKGEYPADCLPRLATACRRSKTAIIAIINQKLDWWGLNYYTPMRVADDPTAGAEFPATVGAPPVAKVKTDIGWEVYAPALKSLVERLYARYELPPCYITENGACYNMEVEGGEVDDQPRLDYYADHLDKSQI
jgi:beta-glucosidase